MSNNQNHHPNAAILPYFVATFEDYAVTIKRDTEYNTVIRYIQKSIPKLRSVDAQNIRISTTLAEYGDTLIRISEETWPDLVDYVKNTKIVLDHAAEISSSVSNLRVEETGSVSTAISSEDVASPITTTNQDAQGTLAQTTPPRDATNAARTVSHPNTERFSVILRIMLSSQSQIKDVHRSSSIGSLKTRFEAEYGIPVALQSLCLLGEPLDDAQTLEQAGITENTTLDLTLNTRKSAIYCFAPHNGTQDRFTLFNVTVMCWLNRTWELVALGSKNSDGSRGAVGGYWNVDVAHDGTIWDRSSKTELECICWDGAPNPLMRCSSELAELRQSQDRIKSMTSIEPLNSALIPLQHIESYISSVLSAVGFDLSAKFLKIFRPYIESKPWKHVAVRFLGQTDTEKSSILKITPPPTKQTRITMLYKGLSDMDELVWGTSCMGLDNNPDVWKDIIAVESTTGIDRDVFSVYEITWMEMF
ncbi:hypothetical protein FRC12_024711 [Ceratobasidium sp. 428]|nr:hypothetical protein FRC12_024711 [Ceratobasidium sp. 428]